VGAFNVKTGEFTKSKCTTYSAAFSEEIINIAKDNEKVVAITAAMPEGTGLSDFSKSFPNRFFDVGIAEQHAVTFAAGLAVNGMKPVFAVYSTFLQRAYDQIIHDVCMQNLPVVFAIDRAGIVGEDGETHQGVFDISYLRHMPNITIMAPKNIYELKQMLRFAFKLDSPVALRYPRGCDNKDIAVLKDTDLIPFKSEIINEGDDILIIAAGRMVAYAYRAVEEVQKSGINVGLINARFIKPIDEDTIIKEVKKYSSIIVVEDNVISGGFGSSILEVLCKNNILDKKVKLMGFPDDFIPHGDVNILFEKYKLDTKGIIENIMSFT
jgi:1-deoxy-D-xylulose-5-phosphate synthase